MPQDSLESAANLAAIFGPEPITPVAETTGLGAEQMKQGIAIARLAIQRNLPHFIQKIGSAFGGLKTTGPVLHGSGERPSDMTEKLAAPGRAAAFREIEG